MADDAKVKEWKTTDFDYHLPQSRIAQRPLRRRDASRLLVIRKDNLDHCYFHQIPTLLPPKTLLVLNDTQVIPARIPGEKTTTGGRVEIFLLHRESEDIWTALAKGNLRKGACLRLAESALPAIVEEVLGEGKIRVRFTDTEDLDRKIEREGITPLPPYIHREKPLPDDRRRYQTVFAREKGAVATPTAGLHFTKNLIEQLKTAGHEIAFLTLHVGLGTFAPVRCERLSNHKMESEFYIMPQETAATVHRAKKEGRCVLAVGSTVTRALESAVDQEENLKAGEGWTDLFIMPGYKFQIPDALITNFHLPRSTLLALTCAFGGYNRIMDAYQLAIKENYRFYSYGDACLIF
jgi:S-adenosylmethionine:tRNA ribosyltransferase-isomerase